MCRRRDAPLRAPCRSRSSCIRRAPRRRSPALHETIRRARRRGSPVHLRHVRRGRIDRRPLARAAAVHPRAHDRSSAAGAPHVRREHPTRAPPRSSASSSMPASRASSPFAATRPPAPPRATRSSAISRAPRSSCSSSTACRPSARRTRRRSSPACRAPRAWSVDCKVDVAVAAFPNGHPRSPHAHAGHRRAARQAGRRGDPGDHPAVLPRRRLPRLRRARPRAPA